MHSNVHKQNICIYVHALTFVFLPSPRCWCGCLPPGGGGPSLTGGWSASSGTEGKEKDEDGSSSWSVRL